MISLFLLLSGFLVLSLRASNITALIHIGTLFAKSAQTVPSLHMHLSFSAKSKPAMDNNPVKFHCNKEGMTSGKDVYHRTLQCFIYVLICHVPVFHVLQLHNKLQKSTCLATPITSTYFSG
jgi:hypothetical protein